jgi:hypothetical protein
MRGWRSTAEDAARPKYSKGKDYDKTENGNYYPDTILYEPFRNSALLLRMPIQPYFKGLFCSFYRLPRPSLHDLPTFV